ncbi:MAG: hypothetical protein AAFN94_12840 [Pseudomonadota bacterium]
MSRSERRALFEFIVEDYRRVNYAKGIAFVARSAGTRDRISDRGAV